MVRGEYKDSREFKNISRFAVDAVKLFRRYPECELPEEQQLALINERTACRVGRRLAERLDITVGDRIPLKGDVFPVNLDLRVRCVLDSTGARRSPKADPERARG